MSRDAKQIIESWLETCQTYHLQNAGKPVPNETQDLIAQVLMGILGDLDVEGG